MTPDPYRRVIVQHDCPSCGTVGSVTLHQAPQYGTPIPPGWETVRDGLALCPKCAPAWKAWEEARKTWEYGLRAVLDPVRNENYRREREAEKAYKEANPPPPQPIWNRSRLMLAADALGRFLWGRDAAGVWHIFGDGRGMTCGADAPTVGPISVDPGEGRCRECCGIVGIEVDVVAAEKTE